MTCIVGVQRCRYGWGVLFPVAIPKSEGTVSSPTPDLWEPKDSIWWSNSSSCISQFHTDETIPYTTHLHPARWQNTPLLLSPGLCEADSAETRATLVGNLCQDQPNSQAKRRLWFSDHNLCMERSRGFKSPPLLLGLCEGQVGFWLLLVGL